MAQSRHVLIKLVSGGFMLATVLVKDPNRAIFIDSNHDSPCTFVGDLIIYFYFVHAVTIPHHKRIASYFLLD